MITLNNASLVPAVVHAISEPKVIDIYNRKTVLFGTSLMTGGKGGLSDGNIKDESTVEYEPDPLDTIQYWG